MPKKFSLRYEYFTFCMALLILTAYAVTIKWFFVAIVQILLLAFFLKRWKESVREEILNA